MRINEANIFLFIATIIIGILISMNLNLDGKMKFLDMDQYQKAYEERSNLQNEISGMEEEYRIIEEKIQEYDRIGQNSHKVVEQMEDELNNNNLALGLESVKGDGIKIVVDDSPDVKNIGVKHTESMIVHNTDIVKIINDLRIAGAEAISINNQRILYDSYILCSGATIEIDGVKLINPFYITAIGNQEVLESYLDNEENHIKRLISRMCFVDVELVYDEKLPGYNGKIENKFMKEPKNKQN